MENWSAQPAGDDFFDPIKHVPLGSGGAWASFGGDARIRAESWQGFNFGAPVGASHEDTFILTRYRAHADFHFAEVGRLFAEIKGAYASDRDLPGGVRSIDEDKFELEQLFFDATFDVGGAQPVTLRLGRQQLAFGAQRLVSALPWANSLRTWDGARATVAVRGWTVDTFGMAFVPVDSSGIGSSDRDQLLYGVYAKRAAKGAPDGVELYALRSEFAGRRVNGTMGTDRRWTLGTRAWGPIAERGDYEVELSYQLGSLGAFDVAAWSVASQVGFKPLDDKSLRLWAGLDWASGDDAPGGDVQTFDQLYPLGHAYFGILDVIGRQNIIDASFGATWKASPTFTLTLGGHSFWADSTDDAIYNAGGGVVRPGGSFGSSDIGYETDLTATWNATRHLTIDAGIGRFFAGDAIEESGPSEDIDFLHLGAGYTF